MERITLGGGCFWCLEAVYQEAKGVLKVESGYMGGVSENPTYKEVCSGTSGHVEVVQIEFDPTLINLRELLGIFFTVHDPTTKDRQGNDAGTQYRSVIFYNSEQQKQVAESAKKDLAEDYRDPIVTALEPVEAFYRAEDYHQNYYRNNPNAGYCSFVVAPKLKKFRQKYATAS